MARKPGPRDENAQPSIITGPALGRSKMPIALPLGAIFAFGVFLFLAWLQPVAQDSRRINLPEQFAFKFKLGSTKPPVQKPPEPEQQLKPRPKKRPPQKSAQKRPMKSSRPRSVQRPSNRVAPPRISGGSFSGGISVGSGVPGGGPSISLPTDDMAVGVAAEIQDMEDYTRRNSAAREAMKQREIAQSRQRPRSAENEPIPVNLPKPRYPAKARQNQTEGFVVIRLLIGVGGKVQESRIIEADPPGIFDEAIKNVLPRWTFRPAQDDKGRPIEATMDYEYVFTLEG